MFKKDGSAGGITNDNLSVKKSQCSIQETDISEQRKRQSTKQKLSIGKMVDSRTFMK